MIYNYTYNKSLVSELRATTVVCVSEFEQSEPRQLRQAVTHFKPLLLQEHLCVSQFLHPHLTTVITSSGATGLVIIMGSYLPGMGSRNPPDVDDTRGYCY